MRGLLMRGLLMRGLLVRAVMRPVLGAWLLGLAGCGQKGEPLLVQLARDWQGYVQVDDGIWPAEAQLALDEDKERLLGELSIEELDEARTYTLLEANEVEIGVALSFIQEGGVREVYLDALEPLDPFYGAFRSRWFCEDEPDGYCGADGIFRLDPPQSE